MFEKIKFDNKKISTGITVMCAVIAGITTCLGHISDSKQSETVADLVDRVSKLENK